MTRALYEKKNSTYWRSEIEAWDGNTLRVWRTLHNVLGGFTAVHTDQTADDFAALFKDEVESVRTSTMSMSTPAYDVPYRLTQTLQAWTLVTADEVEKLIGTRCFVTSITDYAMRQREFPLCC